MADENNNVPPSSSPPRSARRSSFAGETFANLFSSNRGSVSRSPSESQAPTTTAQQPTQSQPGPITTAAVQARRLSLSTLGLSGSPNSTSPFGSYHARRDSYVSSSTNEAIDESAVEDDVGGSMPAQSPFGRRMSFGAKALRDVRSGGGGGSPGQPTNGTSRRAPSRTVSVSDAPASASVGSGTISTREGKGRGQSSEGFNWSDNFRSRAERTASIAGGAGLAGPPPPPAYLQQSRAKSVATMEPPATAMPKPKEQVRPDHFQERILKGDFYMD